MGTVSVCALVKLAYQCCSWTNGHRVHDADARSNCAGTLASRKPWTAWDALLMVCLMIFACALKMSAYWCQLKANEHIYSAHLSAIRKCGVLLVLFLGRVCFNERVGHK